MPAFSLWRVLRVCDCAAPETAIVIALAMVHSVSARSALENDSHAMRSVQFGLLDTGTFIRRGLND